MNVDLEKVILANVRTPDERKGDLGAQLAATLRATSAWPSSPGATAPTS
jgi:N-methylhydantoinase B/oxoprolinase/acetone carboxylase alpha subunit